MRKRLTVMAGVLALALTAGSAASAAVLQYRFDPGSTFDFGYGPGAVYFASGGFDFDTSTLAVTNVTYQAQQSGGFPYVFTTGTAISPTRISFTGSCCGDENSYYFASPLTTGGTIAIIGASYYSTSVVGTGSITAAAVPEASTWAMFLLGFGSLGCVIRSRRGQKPAVGSA